MAKGCKYCNAPLIWAVSEATHSTMPLDNVPSDDGNLIIVDRDGRDRPIVRVLRKDETPPPQVPRYKVHMATCTKRPPKKPKP